MSSGPLLEDDSVEDVGDVELVPLGSDELGGLEGLKVVSHADVERSVIDRAEEEINRKVTESWTTRLNKISEQIRTLVKERSEVEEKLATTAGSLRQVQSWSHRLDEIAKKIRELEKSKVFALQRLAASRTAAREDAVWGDVSRSLGRPLGVAAAADVAPAEAVGVTMTPFGTSVAFGGRSSAVVAPRDPLKKSLLKPKKRLAKEKLGSETRADLALCRSLKPGPVAGETQSMPRDLGDDSDEYVPTEDDSFSDDGASAPSAKLGTKRRKPATRAPSLAGKKRRKRVVVRDDGDYAGYQKRLQALHKARVKEKYDRLVGGREADAEEEPEQFETFPGGYKISRKIWDQLFHYQQVTVRWLWELKSKKCGGIIGDEMGLGKTIQMIAYLVGLSQSKSYDCDFDLNGLGPVLIVAPTTVMHQWVAEFHKWYPEFRVAILHSSGSHGGRKEDLVHQVLSSKKGILITSYSGMVLSERLLVPGDWHYVILDEGHKIRNPDCQTTQVAKKFKTPNRIILSGSPLQNNLRELWSLFDFIFPGKLGTLEIFMKEFSVPITLGGYATATDVEIATAYRCAVVLKDTISPYMIRRMKSTVQEHIKLPTKNEQVLFCKLTDRQRELYVEYLESREIRSIVDGSQMPFVGLTLLRKICNHPHLYDGGPKHFGNENQMEMEEEDRYGYWKLSGKMVVLESLLRIWKKQNHKVLLFSQSRQMLAILEAFVLARSYNYLKVDGTTAISARQPLIKQFNEDPSLFVFLLTTRVGGLGVNLTGATRVLIYDPDWNPSTDTQARERAWRIGQTKHVTIYRLITTGTIEEKIYHRQIFKQYLTNRVLSDPQQRRFFKSNELKDLFTLDDPEAPARRVGDKSSSSSSATSLRPESSDIFAGTGSEINLHKLGRRKKAPSAKSGSAKIVDIEDADERKRRMLELARKLSQQIAAQHSSDKKTAETTEEAPDCKSRKSKKKKKDKEKEREKKLKFAKVDGERVANVLKRRNYKYAAAGDGAENEAANVEDEDNYVLRKLFKKSGVHAALRHDKIVNESAPDHALVEGEAERLAQHAVDALRRSRSFYDGLSRYGSRDPRFSNSSSSSSPSSSAATAAGPPKPKTPEKPRFGKKNPRLAPPRGASSSSSPTAAPREEASETEAVSSAKILAKAEERNKFNDIFERGDGDDPSSAAASSSSSGADPPEMPDVPEELRDLLDDVRAYIAFGAKDPGRATTVELLAKFRDKLPQKQSPVFKALLQKLCEFHKEVGGGGVWTLRGEFR